MGTVLKEMAWDRAGGTQMPRKHAVPTAQIQGNATQKPTFATIAAFIGSERLARRRIVRSALTAKRDVQKGGTCEGDSPVQQLKAPAPIGRLNLRLPVHSQDGCNQGEMSNTRQPTTRTPRTECTGNTGMQPASVVERADSRWRVLAKMKGDVLTDSFPAMRTMPCNARTERRLRVSTLRRMTTLRPTMRLTQARLRLAKDAKGKPRPSSRNAY